MGCGNSKFSGHPYWELESILYEAKNHYVMAKNYYQKGNFGRALKCINEGSNYLLSKNKTQPYEDIRGVRIKFYLFEAKINTKIKDYTHAYKTYLLAEELGSHVATTQIAYLIRKIPGINITPNEQRNEIAAPLTHSTPLLFMASPATLNHQEAEPKMASLTLYTAT